MTGAEERVLKDLDAAHKRLDHARNFAMGTHLQPFVELIAQEAAMTAAVLISCQVALGVNPDDGQPS